MIDELTQATARQTSDDSERQCPYCGHSYQPESATYSESERAEECEECGKTYRIHDSFSVTHYATPDCELNGESHDYQDRAVLDGGTHPFCMKCDKCKPFERATPNAPGQRAAERPSAAPQSWTPDE